MRLLPIAAVFLTLTAFEPAQAGEPKPMPPAPVSNRVFELRTYYTHPGRLDALNKRFREHTCDLFKKHGMELVAFWTPQDKKDVLIYVLAYPSREAAAASWKAFQNDAEWKKAREDSEKDGKIVQKVESIYMDPTDYSAMK